MKVEQVDLKDPRISKISDGLDAHGEKHGVPAFDQQQFSFIASDDSHDFLGGAKGKVFAGWCQLSWLYSTQDIKGVGSQLMRSVEAFAKQHKCQGILVDTLEYQAPDFYTKHGFETFGEIPNFIESQKRLYFIKRF